MNERMTGQFIPGNSVLHRLDARAKLICFIVLIAVVILAHSVIGYALVLAFTAALIIISKLPLSTAIGFGKAYVLVFCFDIHHECAVFLKQKRHLELVDHKPFKRRHGTGL